MIHILSFVILAELFVISNIKQRESVENWKIYKKTMMD